MGRIADQLTRTHQPPTADPQHPSAKLVAQQLPAPLWPSHHCFIVPRCLKPDHREVRDMKLRR